MLLYRQKIERLDQISTLPLEFRAALTEKGWGIGMPAIDRKFVSRDGTVRYLLRLADGETVETVWMPEGDGGESGDGTEAGDEVEAGSAPAGWRRATICVSSQVGCAVNCKFCFTALLGVKRNLEAGEIVGQIAAVLRDQAVEPPWQRVNVVFMGMGEPFLNYDNFMKSVRLLVEGVGIPESRMTVSTAGIVPRIYDFGREPVRPKLAISLNGSNDALRSEVMPLNRKWDIGGIDESCAGVSAAGARAAHLRVCAAGRSERRAGTRARNCEAGAGNAGQGQFDCAQPWVGVAVSHAGCGAGGGFSEDSHVGRDTGVCAASARTGYFCGLRAVKGDGGDSRGDVICEFLASNPHER